MADPQFVEFARKRLSFGTPPSDVSATLRINGLSEEQINEVIAEAQSAAIASRQGMGDALSPSAPLPPSENPITSDPAEPPVDSTAPAPLSQPAVLVPRPSPAPDIANMRKAGTPHSGKPHSVVLRFIIAFIKTVIFLGMCIIVAIAAGFFMGILPHDQAFLSFVASYNPFK